MSAPERVIALWFPDWPVTALRHAQAEGSGGAEADPAAPVALVRANRITACSPAARDNGVRRGQRRRDAQSACPSLALVAADEARDARAFARPLRLIEELSPGVQAPRPGLCLLRARGPARFYGGEVEAAAAIAAPLAEAGFPDVRVGIADGVFAAEQAGRAARSGLPGGRGASPADTGARLLRIAPGGSPDFLAPLPISALGDDETARFLTSLGIRTLGGFADLDEDHVRERLGEEGVFRHACARGDDPRRVSPQPPPPDLARELTLEPPLELAEQVAFAARRTAESFVDGLGREGLICTAVRIVLLDDRDRRSERVWQHPAAFDAPGIVDRVRWQLEETASGPAGAVSFLRLAPEATDRQHAHQPALLGQGPDERAHHAMTRLQALLGHRGVLSPAVGGGRTIADRELLRPWADGGGAPAPGPWPGALPPPLPAEVFRPPRPAQVRTAGGDACLLDDRGLVLAAPATLDGARIVSWAGPWPLVERDWDDARARRAHRFQFVTDRGSAWLVSLEGGAWHVEGRYC